MSGLSSRTPGPMVEGTPALGGQPPFAAGGPRLAAVAAAPEPPRFNWQVMRSLRMHRMLAACVATAVCLILVVLGLSQPQVYKAESRVFVDPLVPGSISPSNGQPGYDQFRYGSYLDQQIQTVTRADILTAALRSVPAGTWRGPNESEQSAVARLQKALVVERLTDGYEFSIKLSTPNPEASAALLNAVTDSYLRGGRKDELTQADGREQILLEERQRIEDALDADQKEQAALGANLGVANPASENGNPFDIELNNLRAQLQLARESHDVAAAQLSSLGGAEDSRHSGLVSAADDSINTDAGLSSMKSSINQRRAILQGLMANMTPSNPLYKQDQDELADLDRLLDAETVKMRAAAERRIQDKLRADLQRTAAVEAQLNRQLAQQTAKATGAGPKLLRAKELDTDIRRLNERYSEVDATLHALELQTNGPGMAHVTLKASVPVAPEPNRRNLFLLAALPLGIFCGAGSAVAARLRDKRVYLGADLEEAIGFPPLAVLPSPDDVAPRVVDEYVLRLAAGVEGAYRNASARSFLVTAVSGRSDIRTLVQALARKLEELRLHVLVLPTVELLVTSDETAERVAASAGPGNKLHTGDGIATAKLDRLKEIYDIVLIDAEPLLHAGETEYAARCAGATILVAESGVTQSQELVRAAALLSRLHIAGVAIVLDRVRLRDADEHFKAAVEVVERRSVEGAMEHKGVAPGEPRDLSAKAVPVAFPQQVSHPSDPEQWLPNQPYRAPEVIEPPTAAPRINMPTDPPYVPDLFKNPSIQPLPPDKKIAPRPMRRESDREDPASADPRAYVIRPVRLGAKRADGTPIPSRFAPAAAKADVPPPAPAPPPATEVASAAQVVPPPVPLAPTPSAPPARPAPVFARFDEPAPAGAQTASPQPVEEAASPVVSEQEPAYTRSRSKIRFAFKEERVDSKTTWFSKLFRGDPPSSFKIVPDDEEEETSDGEWTPIERQPAAPVAAAPVPASAQAPVRQPLPESEPQFEPALQPLTRRRSAVSVVPMEDLQPVAVAAPPATRPVLPQALEQDRQPVPAPAPVASLPQFAAAQPQYAAPAPQPEPREALRPMRPLSFQQLAGGEAAAEAATDSWPLPETAAPSSTPLRMPSRWPLRASSAPVAAREPETPFEPVSFEAAEAEGPQSAYPHPPEPAPSRPVLQRLGSKLEAVQPAPWKPTVPEPAVIEPKAPVSMPQLEFREPPASAAAAPGAEPAREAPLSGLGLSRRWALLSQFDAALADPVPAGRKVPGPRFTESNPPMDREG